MLPFLSQMLHLVLYGLVPATITNQVVTDINGIDISTHYMVAPNRRLNVVSAPTDQTNQTTTNVGPNCMVMNFFGVAFELGPTPCDVSPIGASYAYVCEYPLSNTNFKFWFF